MATWGIDRLARAVAFVALLAGVGACTAPTAVEVVVGTDLNDHDLTAELAVTVAGHTAHATRAIPPAGVFVVTPPDGAPLDASGTLTVQLVAAGATTPRVTRVVAFQFVPHETEIVPVYLFADCDPTGCTAPATCDNAGVCDAGPTPVRALPAGAPDGASCGAHGCPAGSTCWLGLACVPCGVDGAPCCHEGASCGGTAGLVCDPTSDTCTPCGAPGRLCCPDHAHPCPGSGQCVLDAASQRMVCAPCGAPGQLCCPNAAARCVDGALCVGADMSHAGTCLACGAADQPCCGGTSCTNPADECLPATSMRPVPTCEECGLRAGDPCCTAPGSTPCAPDLVCDPRMMKCVACGLHANDPCCTAPGTAPCGTGLVCDPGTMQCETCGIVMGQPCCTSAGGSSCTTPGLACNATTQRCQPCGTTGDLCCDTMRCTSSADWCVPPRNPGDQPLCMTCGLAGEPCCPGATATVCSPGNVCAGICMTCGGSGQPCCAGSSPCNDTPGLACDQRSGPTNGRCEPCGQLDEPCCAGGGCLPMSGVACTVDHQCSPCGLPGQPCCAGAMGVGVCSGTATCNPRGLVYTPAGSAVGTSGCTGAGIGTPGGACDGPSITNAACSTPGTTCAIDSRPPPGSPATFCEACGTPGLVCCPNATCSSGACDPMSYRCR